MQGPDFAVICAWCKRTITPGLSGSPVTHTICPACLEWAMTHPREIPPSTGGGYDDRRDLWDRL